MLRTLLFIGVVLLGLQNPPKPKITGTPTNNNHSQQSKPIVLPSTPTVNPSVPTPSSQVVVAKQPQTPTKESPWFLKPEWVIVWVTTIYTVLTGFMLLTIKRQADLMAEQLADARKDSADSAKTNAETLAAIKEQNANLFLSAKAATVMAMASNKSAKAALAQIEMMKDKERARVEIKALALELTRLGEDFWHIRATIELRNVGAGRAYVRLGEGGLEITGDGNSGEPFRGSLEIVGGFIDPTGDPVKESFYFFQPDSAPVSEYSTAICDGTFGLHISGFIEYETVGSRFRRNFNFSWIGQKNPLNVGAMLSTSDDFVPKTDEERISFGFWAPRSLWITGVDGDNDEYEMKPEKMKKKLPKSPI